METQNDEFDGAALVAVALIAGFVALVLNDHEGLALILLAFLAFV